MAIKQAPVHTDFDMRMIPHPLTGDIPQKINADAIKQSLRNLFFLEAFDIPFDGDKRSGLKEILFEPPHQLTIARLRSKLEWLVNRLEPRVVLQKINVLDDQESNGYQITIYYTIQAIMVEDRFEFFVERVR